MTEATVKVHVGNERIVATAEGNGPVNALDGALRGAIGPRFPALSRRLAAAAAARILEPMTTPRHATSPRLTSE